MDRLYVFSPGGAFHRVGSPCAAGLEGKPDASYSDSSHLLIAQGIVPCLECCEDIIPRYRELKSRVPTHETYQVDVVAAEEES